MKRKIRSFLERYAAPLLALLVLTACLPRSQAEAQLPDTRGQTLTQLHLQTGGDRLAAAWIPYFICDRLLTADNEAAVRSGVRDYLQALRARGIRTVFVHVCAFGESIYPSAYYPQQQGLSVADGLQVFADACAETGMTLHAWLNPLRLQTAEKMGLPGGDAELMRIFGDENLRAESLFLCDGRWYLNPAAPSTAEFLAGVAAELMTQYPIAGVHIDDYFYPSPDIDADAALFAASGADDLADWRREQVSAIVKRMYDAVHAARGDAVFSVSPQGNPALNRDTLFADTARWLAEPGYCDLMIPQLYFGYQNAVCPFSETLAEWRAMPRAAGVALAAGLAAYKTGTYDEHAGTGAEEWQQDATVLTRQIAETEAAQGLAGIALYHADAVLAQDLQIAE